MQSPPDFLLFVGRFHPLFVHLPIGMLVALAGLELTAKFTRFKDANASAGYLIALAAPLAMISALCGWFLSWSGGYDPALLAWHKWLGTATAIGSMMTAYFLWRKQPGMYRCFLFCSVAMMMAAGHLGGSLTHGSDYLNRYAPGPLKKLLGAADKNRSVVNDSSTVNASVYSTVIEPILSARCVECHGASKAKAGLRLDSFEGLQKGSEDGLVLKPGDANHSSLVQRLLLPSDNDDHMPPAGKPQLTAGQIALLKWWVDSGASDHATIAELNPSAEIMNLINPLQSGSH